MHADVHAFPATQRLSFLHASIGRHKHWWTHALLDTSIGRHKHAGCTGAVVKGKVLHLLHAEEAASCGRHTGPSLPNIPEGIQERQHTQRAAN